MSDREPPWLGAFLAALARTGVVSQACKAAGITYGAVYARRQSDGDFESAWTEALAEYADTLEAELLDRAANGTPEPIVHQGALAYEAVGYDASGYPLLDEHGREQRKLDEHGRPVPLLVRKRSDALLLAAVRARNAAYRNERTADAQPTGPVTFTWAAPMPLAAPTGGDSAPQATPLAKPLPGASEGV